jgi:hypothetical protein
MVFEQLIVIIVIAHSVPKIAKLHWFLYTVIYIEKSDVR